MYYYDYPYYYSNISGKRKSNTNQSYGNSSETVTTDLVYQDVFYYQYDRNGDETIFYINGTSRLLTRNKFGHQIYSWTDSVCSYTEDI